MSLQFGAIGLLLKVIQKDRKSTSLFTKVGNDTARSANSLLDTAAIVELGKSTPCAKFLSRLDHDNMDFTFSAKGTDELFVFLILTVLGKAAETSRTAIEGLGALVQSLLQTIVDECLFKHLTVERRDARV